MGRYVKGEDIMQFEKNNEINAESCIEAANVILKHLDKVTNGNHVASFRILGDSFCVLGLRLYGSEGFAGILNMMKEAALEGDIYNG